VDIIKEADRQMLDFNSQIYSLTSNIDNLLADIVKAHPDLIKLQQEAS